MLPSLQVGLEWNIAATELNPLATWFVLTEQDRRPGIFLGTSSDRIGSPEDTQCYFATFTKQLPRAPISVYGSVNYSEWDEAINFPFGAYVEVRPGVGIQPLYDGQRTHLMGSVQVSHFTVTAIWAWLESFGAAVAVGF